MIEVLIPEGPELPLDEARVAELVEKALYAATRDLQPLALREVSRGICRPIPNGWATMLLPFPDYRAPEVWDAIAKVWNSAEAGELTGYLWERGVLKQKISTESEVPPGRESWARHVWGDLVHGPLLHLLRESAIRDLTESGSFTPWALHEHAVQLAAQEVARSVCKSGRRVVATCPIVGFVLDESCDRFDAEPGIVVYRMTEDRKRLLLSQFESEFVDEDMSSLGGQRACRDHPNISRDR